MFMDKDRGTLKVWTKEQQKGFVKRCVNEYKNHIKQTKKNCKCSMKSMMKGVNFDTYMSLSDYQKGRLRALHSGNCNIIWMEEEEEEE